MNFSWMSASKEGNRIGDEEEEVIRSNIHLKATTHTHTHAHAHAHRCLMNSVSRFWDLEFG